ncbi:MAG TPA: 50S ribosomal protein L11 methyltransferase [Desulfomonilaceae bacterium]|nr:50S ribosomal protein L11 methyltransferase [Desulfomonilaceae bacterium]
MIPPETMLYIYEIRGETGIVQDPPSSYIGLWNEEEFTYLFFTDPEDDFVERLTATGITVTGRHEMTYQDWQTGLPPQGMTIGRFHFVPENHPEPPTGALFLDPSVVFGDGNHPTTISCLRFLEEIISRESIDCMLDLGTGSGILALAAARMGVRHIVAVDRNHLAIDTARYNVRINSLESEIEIREGEARLFIESRAELVAANLPFQVLRELVPLRGVTSHRFWIVSGINAEQGRVLKELFTEQGFDIVSERTDHPWITFVAENVARKQ